MTIQLIHGDCLDVDWPQVDAIITDVPYGTTACKWDVIIPFDKMWAKIKSSLKPRGAFVTTASQPFTSALVMSNPDMFRYSWIWEKEQGVNFLTAKKNPMKVHEDILVFYLDEAEIKGRSPLFSELREYFKNEYIKSELSFSDIKKVLNNDMASHYFTNGIQWTLPTEENYKKLQTTGFFQKEYGELKNKYDLISKDCKIPYYPQMEKGKRYTSGKGTSGEVSNNVTKTQTVNCETRYPKSIIKINTERAVHPTQKPVALYEYLIKTYTNEGDTVLDFCAGSGTTLQACINTGRNGIGIEKDEKYYNIAKERLGL